MAASGGATAVACDGTIKQNQTSTSGAKIVLEKYFVTNNQWGASSGSGTQSVWNTCNDGSAIGWGTSFQWTGTANSVKSYASAVLGWAWVTMNVAYDLWIHSVALTGASNEWDTTNNPQFVPTDEVMIWLYRSNGAGPISSTGRAVATVTIAGTGWALYVGRITNLWNVYSFVRTATTNTGMAFNIQDFLTDLVNRGYLSTSKYLSSVQAGAEVFIGQGQLDVSSFSCDVI